MKTFSFQLILLLLSLLLFECVENRNEKIMFIEKFPRSTTLENGIPTKINAFGYASLEIIDSCLILFSTTNNHVFEVYSTKSHNEIGGFGRKGKGPGEFVQPLLTGQITYDKKTKMPLFHTYDLELKRLSYIDLYALIDDPTYISKSEIIPDVGMFVRKVINSNDSLLYFMPENNARMMIYNFTTQENKNIPFLPDIGIPIKEKNKWLVYHSVFAVNNISKKIAAAPMLIGQLDFFDLNGNHIHSTNFDNF